MKISELPHNKLRMNLREDTFITEMGNLIADVTGIPGNITLWTRTQPDELPHTKYRMKVFKNRIHVATYSIGNNPAIIAKYVKNALDTYESTEIKKFIKEFKSLLISYVDGKISIDDMKTEIKKIRGI